MVTTSYMRSPSATSASKTGLRVAPRVAVLGLEPATDVLLRDCFRQFGIESVPMSGNEAIARVAREKMEACVLRLDESANPILSVVRASPSNHRMVIYGICASAQQALRFSRFGINSIINDPVERQNVLRVIRATHLLVTHELRRYVRIPLVSEIAIISAAGRGRAVMQEISGGGLSAETTLPLSVEDSCDLLVELPNLPELKLASRVAWVRPDARLCGFRFDSQEVNRFRVKNWIDEYLES